MPQSQARELLIQSGSPNREYLRDLWRYRELFYFLAWRDILVRYKQTAIGVAWAVIKPLLTMLVLALIFGKLARMPSRGVPYPLLVFAAMLPWQLFSGALTDCSNSLVAGTELISKVYFPRLIIPGSSVIVNLVDFIISGLILAALMLWYGFLPDWRILAIPLFTAIAVALSLGVGLWCSALIVEYRDFRYIVSFAVQLGLYLSPVGFSSNAIPEQWRLLYSLNPMVGIIDGFRWTILRGTSGVYIPGLILCIAVTLLLLTSGLWYFRATERKFADVI